MTKDHTPMSAWGFKSAQAKWAKDQARANRPQPVKACPDCGMYMHKDQLTCEECGHVFEKKIAANK